jgi:hypothetical protein
MKYDARARTRQMFILTGIEHRGAKDGNERLVYYLEGESGPLAIWGTHGVDMRHIHALEQKVKTAGFPVTVECDWIQPDDYEARNLQAPLLDAGERPLRDPLTSAFSSG